MREHAPGREAAGLNQCGEGRCLRTTPPDEGNDSLPQKLGPTLARDRVVERRKFVDSFKGLANPLESHEDSS